MILVDNVSFIKNRFPNCWKQISDVQGNVTSSSIEETKSGDHTLSVPIGLGRIYLHSKYDPIAEAEKIIASYPDIEKFKHVFFYGVGLGYHIDVFVNKYPKLAFSIYEPNIEILYSLLTIKQLEKLNHKFLRHLYIGSDDGMVRHQLADFIELVNEDVLLIVLPSYERAFKQQTNEFVAEFRNAVFNKGATIVANKIFSKRNTLNSVLNLPQTIKSPNIIHEMPDEFREKPVILVAAGPSLDFEYENLRHIKQNGLAYIFSVGSAINSLIEQGIYPDAACTYDGSEKNQYVFSKVIEQEIKDIPLIYGSTVGFETIQNYPGEMLNFLVARDYLASIILKREDEQKLEFISPSKSIAIITLEMLHKLGCSPIILVGQNLAYHQEKSYAQGMIFNNELTEVQRKTAITVKDVYGNDIFTNRGLDTFRQEMENIIKQYPNMNVINTTKGGAHIEGTTFVALEELISEKLTVKQVSGDKWVKKHSCKYDMLYMKEQVDKIDDEYQKLQRIFINFHDLLKDMEKHVKTYNSRQIGKSFNKFDTVFDKLQANLFYHLFLQPMNILKFESIMKMFGELRFSQDVFNKAERVIKEFSQYLEQCQQDLKLVKPMLETAFQDIFESHS